MSRSNVEVVRRLFESYSSGDYAAAVRDGRCVRKLEFKQRSEALGAAGPRKPTCNAWPGAGHHRVDAK